MGPLYGFTTRRTLDGSSIRTIFRASQMTALRLTTLYWVESVSRRLKGRI